MDGSGSEGGVMKGYLTASFIGIIVAICGNVVISFALNCQKLAHKRLDERRKEASLSAGKPTGGGSQQQRDGNLRSGAPNQAFHIATVSDTQPLLFRPDFPARSYTEPVTSHSAVALQQYIIHPLSSPSTSPQRRKVPLSGSALSRASTKTNGSVAAVEDIPEASEAEERGGHIDRQSSDGTIKDGGRERAVSWIDDGGPPRKVTDSPTPASRFQGGAEETEYLKSRLWWLGLLLLNVGEFGNFLSYAFAPASVVAPLGSFALIANCFFAPFMLKERFRRQDLLGIAITILGAVTVVSAAKSKEVRLDPAGLLDAIKRTPFVIYASLNVIAASILAFLSERSAGQEFVVVDVGLCAIFGGFTVLATKAISTLLSLRGFEIFAEPITYPIVAVLAATGLGQIKFLNRALMTFDSKVVIPTQFVLFTLAAIVGSAVLYRDFEDISFHRFVVFIYGCLATFLGVYLLTQSSPLPSDTEREAEAGDNSPRPGTPVQQQQHVRYNFATTFTPLLTPRTIRIPDTGTPTLRSRGSRASLAGISPGFLLLATTAGSPDLGGITQPLFGTVVPVPAESGSRRRTRSESRTPLVSGSLEEQHLDGEMADRS